MATGNLATKTGISQVMVGKYERNDATPFIDVAKKIADAFEVILDPLTGKTDIELDKNTQKRILEVSKFSDEDRNHIFSVIDAFIAKRKIQSIL